MMGDFFFAGSMTNLFGLILIAAFVFLFTGLLKKNKGMIWTGVGLGIFVLLYLAYVTLVTVERSPVY